MCQCTFISCNKYATLVQDVAGKPVCGAGGMWENSVHPTQLCCKSNTALKKKKKRKEKQAVWIWPVNHSLLQLSP